MNGSRFTLCSRSALQLMAAAVVLLAAPAAAQQVLTAPVGPEGTARTLGMSNAVVARPVDAGALTVNPAGVTAAGPGGGSDFMGAGGARGPDFFAGHILGQPIGGIAGGIWAAEASSPTATEQLISYTAGSEFLNSFAMGATLRYERWLRGGDTDSSPNVDLGMHYNAPMGLSFGGSVINLLHPTLFHSSSNALLPTMPVRTDTELIGGVGYAFQNRASLEVDGVYTKDHSYPRVGGELNVAPHAWLRAGLSDKDYSVGGSLRFLGNDLSVAAIFPNHQHTVFAGGVSSHF